MAHKSNAELQQDNEKLAKEVQSLHICLKEAEQAREQARAEFVKLAEKFRELENSPVSTSPTDGHNVDKQELRMLAAACLPSTKDPSGRPHNEATIEVIAPQIVKVAVKLAAEIVSQIP